MTRVLLAEDDSAISEPLARALRREGYEVEVVEDGERALESARQAPDLVVLDLGLPTLDGLDVCRRIRAEGLTIPVLILTARADEVDTVVGLDAGADDYVPFNQAEVIARSQALLRRAGSAKELKRMVFPSIEMVLDLDTQEVFYRGERIQLTGKMFEVMLILARNAPKVVTYDEITMQIWGQTGVAVRNRLKYLVYLLRQEFNLVDGEFGIIRSIDRLGYKLMTE